MNIKWFKGYVNCVLSGKQIESFINYIVNNEIEIWDLSINRNEQASFSISVKDYFKLKPILKKTLTRVHIVNKIGLPFLLNRLQKRIGVLFAIFFFLVLLYLSSTMIWTIELDGNKTIKNEIIYQSLDEMGIKKGAFKFNLPSNEVIKKQLQEELENVAWVGVKVDGTHLQITVVEKVLPEEKEVEYPSDLISSKDAIIYKILAEKGIPQVKINDRVKKGDILISGIIGGEDNNQFIAAKGLVQGIVWYKSSITISLRQNWREYTGNQYTREYIILGNRMIKIKGYDNIPYEKYQISYDWKRAFLKNYELPVGFLTEKYLEYELKEDYLNESDGYIIALEQTKKDLCSRIDTDSKIVSEKIISKKIENDKITLNILYEVVEDISAKQLIIQGE